MTRRSRRWEQLTRIFESMNNDNQTNLIELPHWDFDDEEVVGQSWGIIDFQIEKLPISDAEKKKLINAFYTIGFVGEIDGTFIFFSNGAKGQPEIAEATPLQIGSCPHLPDGWDKLMRRA